MKENKPIFDPKWEIDRSQIDILGAPIGRGQFGNVYRAAYRKSGTYVAVKSSHNQARLTFSFYLTLDSKKLFYEIPSFVKIFADLWTRLYLDSHSF